MKKRLTGFLTAFFILLCFAVPVSGQEYAGGVSAKAAILIEATTGRVLYAKNADSRLPMASTTKIMSALLTLEQPNLDEYFTVDPDAIRVEGSSMGLVEGDQVTLRALAYGMLLPSGNDAANAAAVKIGGTTENFIAMMNKRAELLGLSNTHFVTPSGLHDDAHYSTAKDMAMLTRAALKNPDFLAICSSKNAQLEFGNPPFKRWLKNSNKMLQNYEGAIGVKTGFTDEAGRCLVSAARRNGVTLICVTLSDPNDWQDTANLFDYGFTQVSSHEIPASLAGEKTVKVTGGTQQECKVELYGAATTVVDLDQLTAEFHLDRFYYAPIQAGDIVGRVDYLYEGEVVASQQLMASETVGQKAPSEEEENMFSAFFSSIIGAFEAIVSFLQSFGQN